MCGGGERKEKEKTRKEERKMTKETDLFKYFYFMEHQSLVTEGGNAKCIMRASIVNTTEGKKSVTGAFKGATVLRHNVKSKDLCF